jgi:hypothetical protein
MAAASRTAAAAAVFVCKQDTLQTRDEKFVEFFYDCRRTLQLKAASQVTHYIAQ